MAQDNIVYGRTPEGQLLYDLAFTNMAEDYIARKHRLPVAEVRRLRGLPSVKKLRTQVAKDRKET